MARKLRPVHSRRDPARRFMKPLGLSMNRMVDGSARPVTRIADIVNERRGITADTACGCPGILRTAPVLDDPPDSLRLEIAEDRIAAKVQRDVQPFKSSASWSHKRQRALIELESSPRLSHPFVRMSTTLNLWRQSV